MPRAVTFSGFAHTTPSRFDRLNPTSGHAGPRARTLRDVRPQNATATAVAAIAHATAVTDPKAAPAAAHPDLDDDLADL